MNSTFKLNAINIANKAMSNVRKLSYKTVSNFGNFSYKILNHSDALLFSRNKVFRGTHHDMNTGYIHLSKNLLQCKDVLYRFFPSQSVVIYKLDNSKLINLKENIKKNGDIYLKYNGQLLANHVIDSKSIHHDCNDIMSYWHEINNLESVFGDKIIEKNNIFIKEYAVKY